MTQIEVIYYSATGNLDTLTRAVAERAADEGAKVRLCPVAELTAEMLISFKQHSGSHSAGSEEECGLSPVRTAGAKTPTHDCVLPDSPTEVTDGDKCPHNEAVTPERIS